MPRDPMESYEQAEAEAVERQDEARREQHYAEAEQAARNYLRYDGRHCEPVFRTSYLVKLACGPEAPQNFRARHLSEFRETYGTPALLRVIANALEAK